MATGAIDREFEIYTMSLRFPLGVFGVPLLWLPWAHLGIPFTLFRMHLREPFGRAFGGRALARRQLDSFWKGSER